MTNPKILAEATRRWEMRGGQLEAHVENVEKEGLPEEGEVQMEDGLPVTGYHYQPGNTDRFVDLPDGIYREDARRILRWIICLRPEERKVVADGVEITSPDYSDIPRPFYVVKGGVVLQGSHQRWETRPIREGD